MSAARHGGEKKARKLTNDDLATARDREDWETLWLAARPLVKLAIKRMIQRGELEPTRWADDDLTQEGLLAAGHAVRSWDTLEGAFSTWLVTKIRGQILNYVSGENNGGVGGSRRPGMVFSLFEPFKALNGHEDEESDEDGDSKLDMLPYPEDEVLVSPETTADRASALRVLARLDPIDENLARRIFGIECEPHTLQAAARAVGVSYRRAWTVANRLGEILERAQVEFSTERINRVGTCEAGHKGPDISQAA